MFYHALVPIQAVINNLESVEDLKQHCCNVCACDSAKQSGACRRKVLWKQGQRLRGSKQAASPSCEQCLAADRALSERTATQTLTFQSDRTPVLRCAPRGLLLEQNSFGSPMPGSLAVLAVQPVLCS